MPRYKHPQDRTGKKFYAKPKPEVSTVVGTRKNREPRKKHIDDLPAIKPKVGDLENLDTASIGELTQYYENELRLRGPYTNDARLLRAALNKAYDVEGIKDTSELALIQEAATKRWPMMPSDKRHIVKRTMKHVKSSDPVISIRGIRAAAVLEKMNQTDEHHEDGDLVTNVTINADQTPDERSSRLAAIAKRRGLDGIVIDVPQGSGSGDSKPANGSSPSAGKSNGDASGLRSLRQRREMETGKAPGLPESGSNENHTNGRQTNG